MPYLNSNMILNNLSIKELLEQVKDLDKKEVVLKANVELQPDKDYLLLVRSSKDEGKEFINKTVDIGQKHYYIDVFSQKYVKELIKKTGHKAKFINSDSFLSLVILETAKTATKTKEVKKEDELITPEI